MRTRTMSPSDFIKGGFRHDRSRSTHTYRAYIHPTQGRAVCVDDENGNPVKVEYAATMDMRTVTAYGQGVGFIGGWQYPHRAQKFQKLVESINRGIVYADSNDLPKRFQG